MICTSSCSESPFLVYLMEGNNDREQNPRGKGGAAVERPDIDDDEEDDDEEDRGGGQRGPQQMMLVMDEQRVALNRPVIINTADVLCGRGKVSFNHVGNKRFRDMVSAALEDYMKADSRFEKSIVVHGIVDQIHKEGGRFLKTNSGSDQWHELSQQRSKEKVGHAVRDAANLHEAKLKKELATGMGGNMGAALGGLGSSKHMAVASLPSRDGLSDHALGYRSDSSTSTGRGSKRSARSSLEMHRKRRRTTASPLHLPAEDALRSASALANTLPRNLKRSPITMQSSHEAATSQLETGGMGGGGGGFVASLPTSLRRSPIEQQQQQHVGQHQLRHGMDPMFQGQQSSYMPFGQQMASRGSLPAYSSASQQFPTPQQQPHHLQRRSSMPMFDNMYQGMSLQQALPPTLPLAPHVQAAMLHAPNNSFNDSLDAAYMPQQQASQQQASQQQASQQQASQRQGNMAGVASSHMPRQPDMMLPNNPNMMSHMQMLQQMQQRERFFPQGQYQSYGSAAAGARFPPQFQGYPSSRVDENEDFLAAIDSVLGPLQPDPDFHPNEGSTSGGGYEGASAGYAPTASSTHSHQQLNNQIQLLQQRIQEQYRQRMEDPEGNGGGDPQGGPPRHP